MDRQYRLALMILLIPLFTLTASTLTYFFGYKPIINTKGMPIEPKIEISDINLITESGDKFQFTPGKFYFVYFDNFNDLELSKEKYDVARSSKLTLRREGHRLLRIVVYNNKDQFERVEELRADYPGVIYLYDKGDLFKNKTEGRLQDPYFSNSLLLVDSFALLIWEFQSELTFSDVFEEVKKIL